VSNPITQEQIKTFVAAWYRALDNHDGIEECYPLLAENGLNMQFPDGDIRDYAGFKKWYDRVTNLFFDENHNVVSVERAGGTDSDPELQVVVAWQASWFEKPATKAKRTSLDAVQTWTITASKKNRFGIAISKYNAMAKPFVYAPGFARL